jgi:hypothetical protein
MTTNIKSNDEVKIFIETQVNLANAGDLEAFNELRELVQKSKKDTSDFLYAYAGTVCLELSKKHFQSYRKALIGKLAEKGFKTAIYVIWKYEKETKDKSAKKKLVKLANNGNKFAIKCCEESDIDITTLPQPPFLTKNKIVFILAAVFIIACVLIIFYQRYYKLNDTAYSETIISINDEVLKVI